MKGRRESTTFIDLFPQNTKLRRWHSKVFGSCHFRADVAIDFSPFHNSHAAFGNFWGHQKSLNGIDVKIVVNRVRGKFAILTLRTVKGIWIIITIYWRHFNVTCDGLRFWRRRDNCRVGWEWWQNGGRLFEASILIDKLIVLKRLARHSYEIRLIFWCSYIRVDSSICPFIVRFVIRRGR